MEESREVKKIIATICMVLMLSITQGFADVDYTFDEPVVLPPVNGLETACITLNSKDNYIHVILRKYTLLDDGTKQFFGDPVEMMIEGAFADIIMEAISLSEQFEAINNAVSYNGKTLDIDPVPVLQTFADKYMVTDSRIEEVAEELGIADQIDL